MRASEEPLERQSLGVCSFTLAFLHIAFYLKYFINFFLDNEGKEATYEVCCNT